MEALLFEEIAVYGLLGGYELPLELGGETVAGPAGEGVGFEEAEVADGGLGDVVEGLPAAQGEDAPAGFGGGVATPVEGRLPGFGVQGVPALREPELGAGVAVFVEEGEVLGAGDGAGGEAEGREIDGVARGFVVEGEGVEGVGVGGDAGSYDAGVLGGAGGEVEPVEGWGHAVADGWGGGEREIGGLERVGEEGVLDVGGGQLEVLLFVLEAEDDAALGFVGCDVGEEALDGGVNVTSVGEDLVEGRAGEGGAELLFGHLAEGAVVAIEEPFEVGVEGLVASYELREDEGFEEPGGVGEVPFDGGGFGTGLNHHVFRGERTTEGHGGGAHGAEAVEQRGGAGGLGGEGCLLRQHGALQLIFDASGAWMLHKESSVAWGLWLRGCCLRAAGVYRGLTVNR